MLAVFGVSWFASILWPSPVLATASGLVAVLILGLSGIRVSETGSEVAINHFWGTIYPAVASLLGLIGLAGGCVFYFTRRVLA